MMPPPTMSTRLLTVPLRLRRSSRLNDPPAERIGVVEDERRLRGHVRASGDVRQDVATLGFVGRKRGFEHGADDALLPPELTGLELARGMQARELCAGTGPARRAVVG